MTIEITPLEGNTEGEGQVEGQVEGTETETNEPAAEEGSTSAEGEPAAYAPNFKYSVRDEEHEMEEWVRPFVKDSEMENKFRDLFTRAHGIAQIKEQRDSLREEFDSYKSDITQKYAPIVQNYQRASTLLQDAKRSGDFAQFLQAVDVPVKDVLQWAANTVAQMEQNPNYLGQIQNDCKANQTQYTLQQENEMLKQRQQEFQMQMQQKDLEYALASTEVQQFAKDFDARAGKAGAFRNEIIQRGAILEHTTGKTVSASEIAQQLMQTYGGASQVQNPTPQGGTQQGGVSSDGKPVIPRVEGRGGSPVKKTYDSIEELRKLRSQRKGATA